MSRGGDTRFRKGQSGNPSGRPKKRRPHVSAFDVIVDKTLTVTQSGVEREFTVAEALQLQTYQAGLNGSKLAIRTILKMIAKREEWLVQKDPPKHNPVEVKKAYEGRTADEALLLLGIAVKVEPPMGWPPAKEPLLKLEPWVAEEGLRRSRRREISDAGMQEIRRMTFDPENPSW